MRKQMQPTSDHSPNRSNSKRIAEEGVCAGQKLVQRDDIVMSVRNAMNDAGEMEAGAGAEAQKQLTETRGFVAHAQEQAEIQAAR